MGVFVLVLVLGLVLVAGTGAGTSVVETFVLVLGCRVIGVGGVAAVSMSNLTSEESLARSGVCGLGGCGVWVT